MLESHKSESFQCGSGRVPSFGVTGTNGRSILRYMADPRQKPNAGKRTDLIHLMRCVFRKHPFGVSRLLVRHDLLLRKSTLIAESVPNCTLGGTHIEIAAKELQSA